MLKNLSLSLKLALLPTIAVLGLLLFVAFATSQLSNNDQRLNTLEQSNYPTLEKADAAIFKFSLLPGMLNSAVAASEASDLDQVRTALKEIDTLHSALQPLTRESKELTEQLRLWQKAVRQYSDNALSTSAQLIAGSANFEDLRGNLDRMAGDLQSAQKRADEFRSLAYQDFRNNLEQARADNTATIRFGVITTVALVILLGLGAWLVISSIMRNVHGVIDSLTGIAQGDGDLSRRVEIQANDEIGQMIGLFN